MDWMDKTREDQFIYEMIDPFNLDSSRGFLNGVVADSPSLTFGYYTDTRVSGSLDAINSNYIEYSLIRIFHHVPEWNYEEELGTFFVSNHNGSMNQADKRSFDLVSMLCRVSDDYLPNNLAIANNSYGQDALKKLFSDYSVSYSLPSGLNNKRYTQAFVYEVGENVLSTMFDISSDCSLRLDVNGHGLVTVENYVAPSASKTPIFTFSKFNGTINGEISRVDDLFGSTNRVIVTSDKEEQNVSGYADRDANSKISYNKLGRRNTAVESITDLTPFNTTTATNQAKSLLSGYEESPIEYSFSGIYIPNKPGENIVLDLGDVEKICMIKNKTVKLTPGMITDYTVKEV